MPKHYELTYTTSKNLRAEESDALLERVTSLLPQAMVLKKGYDFFSLEFYAEPDQIQDLGKKLKADAQIVRFMILVKKLAKAELKPSRRMTKEPLIKSTEIEKMRKQKVELKEIGKKLDEILKE